jgi:asparagine synthase (glutamine-hydrolysing)
LVREVRYPYLDRDFLEFMYSIPQEQIVGVGKRRFLTKRALVGIVPNEVLSRRQTFVVTADWQKDISTPLSGLAGVGTRLISSSVGIIDSNRFVEALRRAHRNEDIDVGNTKRALVLESWLRQLSAREILSDSQSPYPHVSGLKELEIRALSPQDQLASSWKANTTTERR